MSLESFSQKPESTEPKPKREARKFVITGAHQKGALTEGSDTYGQMKTTTIYTGGESGTKEGVKVKKTEFLNNKTEDRTRETEYSESGRKVTRYEDRVEAVYGDGKITDPNKISKEIYERGGKKTIIYGDGRQEEVLKGKSESKITKLNEELIEVTYDLTARISQARKLQSEIDQLNSQIIETQATTPETTPQTASKESKKSVWGIFGSKKVEEIITKPEASTVQAENNQAELKSQIENLKAELSQTLGGLSIEEAVKNKNELVQKYLQSQIDSQFKSRYNFENKSYQFEVQEYSKYRADISEFISSIYSDKSSLFTNITDIDKSELQEKVLKDILVNFESPYGLNAFLTVCASKNYDNSLISQKFTKDRFYPLIKNFIESPSYGHKSEFISDPRFLKFYTSLSNINNFKDIDLGTPRESVWDIWKTLSTISTGGQLNKEQINDIINLIPDNYNPNTTSDKNNFVNFYKELNKLISNQDYGYTKMGYVPRFPQQAKAIIQELLNKNTQTTTSFLREAVGRANEMISETSITNSGRVIEEMYKREENLEISANFINESKVKEFYESQDTSSHEKERFFLSLRDNFERNATYNSLNSFLSSLSLGPSNYKNSYLTQSAIESIKKRIIDELKEPQELNNYANPRLFQLLGNQSDNVRGDIIFSQVFNDQSFRNNDQYNSLRSFYGKYVVNLYPNNDQEGSARAKIIEKMNQIYPSGIIFKNLLENADLLSQTYENLEQDFPFIFNSPDAAKAIIEKLTPKNRNLTVAEFRQILEKANNELALLKPISS
jgi:hypothetical protein